MARREKKYLAALLTAATVFLFLTAAPGDSKPPPNSDKAIVSNVAPAATAVPGDARSAQITDFFSVILDGGGTASNWTGTGYSGGQWYYYPNFNWWNVWFANPAPFPQQEKRIHLEFDLSPIGSGANLTMVYNYATTAWEQLGLGRPPLPPDVPTPSLEGQYIVRLNPAIFTGLVTMPVHVVNDFTIVGECPEWISLDIRGQNVELANGVITHECITSEQGACCYDGPPIQCVVTDPATCQQFYAGTYMGAGTDCTDSDGNQIADVCDIHAGACCSLSFPGYCMVTDPQTCLQLMGIYMGDNTNCDDLNGNGQADICEFLSDEFDFGDAPEGSLAYPATGMPGQFPTCISVGPAAFIRHNNFGGTFGGLDFEPDGNAGFCPLFSPNTYDRDECFADGDAGLMYPGAFTIQGPVGLEGVVPCPGTLISALGPVCTNAAWGANLDIAVSNFMPGGTTGYVNVLFDWDHNGSWGGSSTCPQAAAPEHVLVNFPVPNGYNGPLSGLGPPGFLIGPNGGYVWARFTFTERQVPSGWTGDGVYEDGETEDYLLLVEEIQEEWDFGDLPDPPYPTVLGNNGARHLIVPGFALGPAGITQQDAEIDGFPSPLADGDDLSNLDDEDGITFVTVPMIPGQQAIIDVTNNMGAGGVGYLEGWIDFNNDGSFAEAGDQIFFSQPLSPFPINFNTFFINVPASATPGINAFARFRFSSNAAGWGSAGPAQDGEVEDYIVPIGEELPTADLGDAPDSSNSFGLGMTAYPPGGGSPNTPAYFPTVYQAGSPPFGPIHRQPRAMACLGTWVTLEQEADIGPDEDPVNNLDVPVNTPDKDLWDDGPVFPLVFPHCMPTTMQYTVTITSPALVPLYVNVWFDWNLDGDWDDSLPCPQFVQAPEWAVQNMPLPALPPGTYTLTTPPFIPWHLSMGDPSQMWMRITLSEQQWAPGSGLHGEGGSGPPGGYEFGETEDYYFKPEIPTPQTPKWNQPPHFQGQGFDAASDVWWTPGAIKWSQQPNPQWSGLHAHDYFGPLGYEWITLADDWLCQGGDVTDLHWWGNYELDAFGQEIRGAGIQTFRLSLHTCAPGTPWCVPQEPALWANTFAFAQVNETATGMLNSEGSMIYAYGVDISPFPQQPGMYYWLDITARSVDANQPALWRWQESSRASPPQGHAPAASQTNGGPWMSIVWPPPPEPERYSDMAFAITSSDSSQPPEPVNKVVADDFISDGRPIRSVRWWGSYLDERYAPGGQTDPEHVMDGWFLSFHWAHPGIDVADCPPDVAIDPPPSALAIYFAPVDAVHKEPLPMSDCFSHQVYMYTIDLSRCCLVCSEVDPRFPQQLPPGEADGFHERGAARYWLDIQAVTGVTWIPPDCQLTLTGHLPSDLPETNGHFWGWHTSPADVMPQGPLAWACTGQILDRSAYPPSCWYYGNWTKQPWECPTSPPPQVDMAFMLYADPCVPTGDLNQDGSVNGLDVQCMVDCVLGYTLRTCWCACGDINADLDVDLADVAPFVNLLLSQ